MSGTRCLRSLATKALERLERNEPWNKVGINDENLVPRAKGDRTRNHEDHISISDLQYDYEERLAIMEYDGGLDADEAMRITTSDLFKVLL